MAANINRVVLVGNLTRDPELRHTPGGTAVCRLRIAVNARTQGRDRPVGRQAELLQRHRLGQPGRELRAVPREGPARRDRRPARLARVGGAGRTKRQAVEIIADSVQFLGGRGDGEGGFGGGGGNQFVPAGAGSENADFPAAADDDIPF